MTQGTETRRFEAETQKLLELMVHSLYSGKEVFLRELISNASDAIDKLRLLAATDEAVATEQRDPEIRIEVDAEKRTLSVSDNGVGMSRDEVIENIGTIARSGTEELLKRLTERPAGEESPELIGQFGVGFYSSFMVARRVDLITRRAGESGGTRWVSTGDGEYTIADAEKTSVGTCVTLHLRDVDEDEGLADFTAEHVVRRIVKTYSDFVRHPIKMRLERQEEVDGETKTTLEDETLNSMKALWLRPESEVGDEERSAFYRLVSHDWNEPLESIFMRAEGLLEYHALLFLPKSAPMDLFSQGYERGLQLYVRSVRIMERCEELLPRYLRFVKGVVDAQDLPLNVSREMLQDSRQVGQIRRALTKKVLDTLAKRAKDEAESYTEFWNEFGAVLKEGLTGDAKDQERILPLLRFPSTRDASALTDLAGYVERMPEEQEAIYYLAGEAREAVEGSPHLEAFRKKGFEVLFMLDPVDEFMLHTLSEFDGKPLRSVGKGELELDADEEKQELEEKSKDFSSLLEALGKALGERVEAVRLSARLTDSPACLVGEEHGISPHIERLLQRNKMDLPQQKRTLELNPEHEVVARLRREHEGGLDEAGLAERAELLFGMALLAESAPLPDPAGFAKLVAKLMS